ncbi:NADH:ubiquinone oxidoreductase subunit NDUFA12 [Pleomorphomonas sp. JP5]|uniref:NADH:ubiquinone oxidoreductase subunit NDUFA12 n=1 Tax=Pleomorphomonas sp. JP5 TaxID=2942998 RepID=UPI002043F538|nr:NADH:ubiquinone oxidoreductase subunit NDUFA12 [Pleomorphomonas sp. JP5]MCM5558324.1 NADH:ubiquinone oxidoreductase subunit NDUFA12 [Pleomorphomonas sp. JP5]
MTFKELLTEVFTWWNGQTLGTRFYTWRKGQRVGEDEFGNVYYQTKGGERRWVIYKGEADASKITVDWHGWMHHRVDVPPTAETYRRRDWQKPHKPNMTGTAAAYRPKGSLASAEGRPAVTGDYDAWTPGT